MGLNKMKIKQFISTCFHKTLKKKKLYFIRLLLLFILLLLFLFQETIIKFYEIERFKADVKNGVFYKQKSIIPEKYFGDLSPLLIEKYIKQSSDLSLMLNIIVSHDKRYIEVLHRLNSYPNKKISRYCPKGIIWLKQNIQEPYRKETELEEVRRFMHFFNAETEMGAIQQK